MLYFFLHLLSDESKFSSVFSRTSRDNFSLDHIKFNQTIITMLLLLFYFQRPMPMLEIHGKQQFLIFYYYCGEAIKFNSIHVVSGVHAQSKIHEQYLATGITYYMFQPFCLSQPCTIITTACFLIYIICKLLLSLLLLLLLLMLMLMLMMLLLLLLLLLMLLLMLLLLFYHFLLYC